MLKYLSLVIIFLIINVNADQLNKKMNLDQLIKKAVENNMSLKSLNYKIKEAEEIAKSSGLIPDMTISFSNSIDMNNEFKPNDPKFAISQLYPNKHKLNIKKKFYKNNIYILKEKYNNEKLKIIYLVKQVYYDLYYLTKNIEITKENIKLMNYFEKIASSKYKVSQTPYSNVLKAQIELNKLKDNLKTLTKLKESLIVKLNNLLNFKIEFNLPSNLITDNIELNFNKIKKELLENNYILKMEEYEINKSFLSKKMSEISTKTDIFATAEYQLKKDDNFSDNPFLLKFSVNFHPRTRRYYYELEQKKMNELSSQKNKENTKNNLITNLRMIVFNINDMNRKINLYKNDLIKKAEQNLSVIEKSFMSGNSDFLDLIDAQKILLEFKLSYEKSLTEKMKKIAELNWLISSKA